MYKKSLLSSMATAAIVLFNIQFNVHAESLEVSGEKKEVKDATYETLHALKGGQITGKHLTVKAPYYYDTYAVTAEGANSMIELLDNTIIENKDNEINLGLEAKDGATIKMIGGSIITFNTGASFTNSKSKENTLENVLITNAKDDLETTSGIVTKNSNLTLKDVTAHAFKALEADDHSQITISGGEFNATLDGISAKQGSIIDINNNAKITSSLSSGLHANGPKSKITMTGGTVKGGTTLGTLRAENGGHIDVTDVVITSVDYGTGAFVENEGSVIELHGTTIKDVSTGIEAHEGSTVKMTGGSITASIIGAQYTESNSDKNKLEDVVISSLKDDETPSSGVDVIKKSKLSLKNVTITQVNQGINALDHSQVTVSGGSVCASTTGASATSYSTITLKDNVKITQAYHGIDSSDHSQVTVSRGSVSASTTGAFAASYSTITLKDKVAITQVDQGINALDHSQVTVSGGSISASTVGMSAESGSIIDIKDEAHITSSNGGGLYASDLQSKITMMGGTVNAKEAALYTANGGHVDVTNVSATGKIGGLQLASVLSTVLNESYDPKNYQNTEINLTNTKIHVDNGTGILIATFSDNTIKNITNLSIGTANLINSEIHADVLLGNGTWGDKDFLESINAKTIPIGSFTLNADHSILEGRANIAKERNVHFDLKNGTQWFLKNSTQEKDDNGKLLDIAQRSRSDVSVLDLNDSSLIFQEPTEDHYHTLHIGSGKPETKAVYNATGDAQISFNTWWSDGKPIAEQKTDQLLINGDVSGTTNVLVNLKGNTTQQKTSNVEKNIRGLSLIQVSGTAEESSFKLAHGYTTINGSPDKYMLRAYGPNSSQGKADIKQNLFDEKNENFWDFRLQPEFLNSNPESGSNTGGSGSHPEENVHAPVAQMASYLVMPNALFYSGLTDMAEQNALLANIRTSLIDKGQEKQNGFFLHTYGSTGTFSSESAPRQYGYSGADLRYAALQGGVNFATLEGHNTTTRFGLLGTYGQLSFTPKDMQDAGKNTVDKWSLTAYGTIQYDNGFYLDTLLSYGFLKGEITNAVIGTTAKLKNAKMLNISTTVGKQFATGMQGVTFEPQAQVAYQHLAFDTILDADNFTIDMNNPHQWMIRVGGRLTKSITAENNRPMSFYGKVNLIKTFGDDQALHIDKDYKLDAMGAAIEGGLGISAQLSTNLSLHGDVSYQQKLQKTGISGASFSGGIRYQF
ncbi:autotransporter outer membrane beta-barrel domain-containing protein [Bartonella krasnovii]|uniref:autotransporter outer membrane beta-barrel domain-containing protein n=1 Tax=Bartonella krasnovii TaxID=2267275 RepID=UPI001F4CD51F|nr:autotransporter outer membrane beta-barrel domain-containing protein [Bartonella krasnovii]UNF46634.1 autotransporter outer membrane beta-barrel domain-containing protein [Bartonella krasnovii]